MKFKDFHEAQNYVCNTIIKYMDSKNIFESVLVLLRQRYADTDKYKYIKLLITTEDGELIEEFDWNEGQSDVDVIAIIPIDEIEEFSYIENEEAWKDYKERIND